MKKIIFSVVAALAGMSFVFAQNFTLKTSDGDTISEGSVIVVTGEVDWEDEDYNNNSIKLYLELTNTSSETLKFQPSFDVTGIPEGATVNFCAGSCFDITRIPEQEVAPNAVFGADHGMDIEYGPNQNFTKEDTAVVGCVFNDVNANKALNFTVKFVATKPASGVANQNRELAGVSVYPNPSTGLFNLDVPARANVEIFAVNGQLVKQMEVMAGKATLQIDRSGVYFMRVRANGKSTVKRIVVGK